MCDPHPDSRSAIPDRAEDQLPRWIQVIVGLLLGSFALLCTAGSVALIFSENARAPLLAPAMGVVMVLLCCWLLEKSARLILGRSIDGGLMRPRTLRLLAWGGLLLPLAGFPTGYFVSHPLVSAVQSAANVCAFFGIRALARSRERRAAQSDASVDLQR